VISSGEGKIRLYLVEVLAFGGEVEGCKNDCEGLGEGTKR
jgi:hypothetical protein